ncbi:embryonal Fyn-associated substrate-like, partial [Heterodontus francisci]|uniref:embryonal Fyn-associated substrate-like n=1 Tax=Heterodontus francisci TaxID=7792 RepID=UPI00355BB2D4
MSVSMSLAKALYDNMAESADELSFRRGDILMVVENDMAGLGGWWLCSLHGRRGIVPGNRLKLLEGGPGEGSLAPPPDSQELGVYQVPPSLKGLKISRANPPSEGSEVYQVPPSCEGPKVNQMKSTSEGSEVYQVPSSCERSKVNWVKSPSERSEVYQVPPWCEGSKVNWVKSPSQGSEVYQVPLSHEGSEVNRTPPSTSRSLSEAKTQERKVANITDWEIDSGLVMQLTAEDNVYTVPNLDIYKVPTCGDLISKSRSEQVYNVPRSFGEEECRRGETYDIPGESVRRVNPEVAWESSSSVEHYDWPRETVRRRATPSLVEQLGVLRLSVLGGSSRLMDAVSQGLGGRHLAEVGSSGVGSASRDLGCSLGEFLACCRGWDPQGPALGPHLQCLEEDLCLLGELGHRLEVWEQQEEPGCGSLSGLQDLSQFAAITERIGAHTEAAASLLLLNPRQAPALPPAQAPPRLLLGEAPCGFRRPLPPLPESGGKTSIQARPLPPTPDYAHEKPAEDTNVYEGLRMVEEQQYVRLQGKKVADDCWQELSNSRDITEPTAQLKENQ